jgi:hypothetical protein
MKEYFCWRCDKVMPFLNEREWKQISPLLESATKTIKDHRHKHVHDLHMAHEHCMAVARARFEELTGMAGVSFWTILHHRLRDWGKACPSCGHLLRTPETGFCAHCGWKPRANKAWLLLKPRNRSSGNR